jgi:putative molybdopterin biosynthesis protein
VRVNVGRVGGRMVVRPLGRGAGALTTVVRADGFVRVPPTVAVLRAGEEVGVELLRPLIDVFGTVLVAGAHDPCLGLLEDALRAAHPEYKLAPSWVGTRAGLLALASDESHVAAVTPADADLADVARSLAETGARIVHVAARTHGILVPRGNPLGLRRLADLRGRRVQYVARRWIDDAGGRAAGAGAFDVARSAGSAREALTHTAVAEAVRCGLADAGLGAGAAAASLGLDFVALGRDDYDLVLREDFASSEIGEALLAALRSEAFRTALGAREGYDVTRTGLEKSWTAWGDGAA